MELSHGSDFREVPETEVDAQPLAFAKPARADFSNIWVGCAALVALFVKLTIAYNTFGTNDVAAFYMFGRSLAEHGLEWTYRNAVIFFRNFPVFNHPPLTAYYIQLIETLSRNEFFRAQGLTFPFLLRLPGIIADFIAVLTVQNAARLLVGRGRRIPLWAMLLFALSPVSLMISGFHGNTDPVMVMFLILAASMCLHEKPFLCGIFFALSCQIKVIPLLFLPTFVFFWWVRGLGWRFTSPVVLLSIAIWIEPMVRFPALFLRNVLTYSSYWGGWGISYWLELTGWRQFNGPASFHLPPWAAAATILLKAIIIAVVLVIAWRRRWLDGSGVIDSIAYSWIVLFIFAPGISVQYMIWLAPFVLMLSPGIYAWLTLASSVFLFWFYNVTANAWPWFIAISRNNLKPLWEPWSLWPWATLLVGIILLWKKARAADPSLCLVSLKPVGPID